MKLNLSSALAFLVLNLPFVSIVCQLTPVKGYIIEIKEGKVYLDLTINQVNPGTKLKVIREGGVFTHPVTGAQIKEEDEIIANLEVTEAKTSYSVALAVPAAALNLLAKGMIVYGLDEAESASNTFKKAIAVQPLNVSNTQGFLGIYIGDVLTEKLLIKDNFRILDRQTLGLKLDNYLLSSQGMVSQAEIMQYSKSTGADYYITGTMYEPDVVEISSGVPVKDIVKIAGFAAEAITGKDLKVDAIASFVPEKVEVKKLRSIVRLNLKVVDVNTGEILFLCTEMQESIGESEINLEGGMLGGLKLQGGAATFLNTVTGQATNKALENLIGYIMGYFDGTIKTKTYTGNVIEIGRDKAATEKLNKEPKIIKIEEVNNEKVATINKGRKSKAKGGRPRDGNAYAVYMPEYETSAITGEKNVTGRETVGMITDLQTEFDASRGTLKLKREIPHEDLIQKSMLKILPDRRGFMTDIGIVVGKNLNYEHEVDPSTHGGLVVMINARIGYQLNPYLYLALGSSYSDINININGDDPRVFINNLFNIPLYLSGDIYLSNKSFSPYVIFNIGGYIYSSTRWASYYDHVKIDYLGLYYAAGLGIKYNLNTGYGLKFSMVYQNQGRLEYHSIVLARIKDCALNISFFF